MKVGDFEFFVSEYIVYVDVLQDNHKMMENMVEYNIY